MIRVCTVCGAEFWTQSVRGRTCSYECHHATRPPGQNLRALWRRASLSRWQRAKAAREAERRA